MGRLFTWFLFPLNFPLGERKIQQGFRGRVCGGVCRLVREGVRERAQVREAGVAVLGKKSLYCRSARSFSNRTVRQLVEKARARPIRIPKSTPRLPGSCFNSDVIDPLK